ncbi:MAG: allantoin permease, partial [Ottowia sp.]
VSLQYLSGMRWPVRRTGMALAVVATACALWLPMHSLEPFLLMLSSVFVPLFGVVIAQHVWRGAPAERTVHLGPALVWLAGIAVFHLGAQWWPAWGSALPALAFTFALASALRLSSRR